jgi:hypothetical protein
MWHGLLIGETVVLYSYFVSVNFLRNGYDLPLLFSFVDFGGLFVFSHQLKQLRVFLIPGVSLFNWLTVFVLLLSLWDL